MPKVDNLAIQQNPHRSESCDDDDDDDEGEDFVSNTLVNNRSLFASVDSFDLSSYRNL